MTAVLQKSSFGVKGGFDILIKGFDSGKISLKRLSDAIFAVKISSFI